jgi:hypothetical protein
MDVKAFQKRLDSLKSVKIIITPNYKSTKVVLYENTETTSGIMSHTTTTKNLIGYTMLSYIHILCEIDESFDPVIRFANEYNENVVTLVVFRFDKKHLPYIRKKAKFLANLYNCKAKVTLIDFKETYSKVMETKEI